MIFKSWVPQAMESGCVVQIPTSKGIYVNALAMEGADYTLISESFAKEYDLSVVASPRTITAPWDNALEVSGHARVPILADGRRIGLWGNITNTLPPGIDVVLGNFLHSFRMLGVYGELLRDGSYRNPEMHFMVFQKEVAWTCIMISELPEDEQPGLDVSLRSGMAALSLLKCD